ncbi:hypothetical protein [Sciscionella sediminilitoris]|uniref:hypothetical protein n=1 Tax=Sciscionella sediminilitoris TaxID=1445613 RepID=UPI0012E24FA7|nr:hypothetical protein [Sciscionella sp. SE31]
MEYDSAAMRNALSTLRDSWGALNDMRQSVDALHDVVQPGRSEYTTQFHKSLIHTNQAFVANHRARRQEIAEALNELIAIDKAYNNAELVNELDLKTVTIEKSKE